MSALCDRLEYRLLGRRVNWKLFMLIFKDWYFSLSNQEYLSLKKQILGRISVNLGFKPLTFESTFSYQEVSQSMLSDILSHCFKNPQTRFTLKTFQLLAFWKCEIMSSLIILGMSVLKLI